MKLILGYWIVVLIWSTTPMGMVLSNDNVSFMSAAGLRLLLALIILVLIALVRRRSLFPHPNAKKMYLVAALGICPQMSLVYWSAQYVSSGVMSIVFALSPCFTYLASLLLLRNTTHVSVRKMLSLCVAVSGMAIIFMDQLNLGVQAAWGIVALLGSSVCFAVSTVLLKRYSDNIDLDPLSQTTGTLLFTFPVFAVCWFCFDGQWPENITLKSAAAISYLAMCGTVVGFSLYFWVFQRMNVVTVSLITMISPLFATSMGVLFLGEQFTWKIGVGGVLVLLSLLYFEGITLKYIVRLLQRPSAV